MSKVTAGPRRGEDIHVDAKLKQISSIAVIFKKTS